MQEEEGGQHWMLPSMGMETLCRLSISKFIFIKTLLSSYCYTHFRDKETEDCLFNKPTYEAINSTIVMVCLTLNYVNTSNIHSRHYGLLSSIKEV